MPYKMSPCPIHTADDGHVAEAGSNQRTDVPPLAPAKPDIASVIKEMDERSLVLALVAINPDLDDILPDDTHLRRDKDLDKMNNFLTQRVVFLGVVLMLPPIVYWVASLGKWPGSQAAHEPILIGALQASI